jgi:serine/threonine protein phosphatase PrpC
VETTVSARPQGQELMPRRPRVPSLAPAVVTTRGCRETNQDRVCALRTLVGGEPAVLLALADGVGGLPAGEQAAELALQVVSHYAHYVIPEAEPVARGIRDALAGLLHAAGRRIWLWARDQGLGGAAGSTLVCALVWDRHYLVAHAGDSRCYYVNHQGANVLTRDHTEAVPLEREAGPILEGSHRGPLRHRLTNTLGWSTDLVVDLTPVDGEPGSLDDDCALLVCSDGLHTMVTESDIHAALHRTRGVEEACRRLVTLALDRGSSDNVSVAAVEIGHLRRSAHSA